MHDLVELRMIPSHECILHGAGIYTIEEALRLSLQECQDLPGSSKLIGRAIHTRLRERYRRWCEVGMEYSDVPGTPDEPTPEEIRQRTAECRKSRETRRTQGDKRGEYVREGLPVLTFDRRWRGAAY